MNAVHLIVQEWFHRQPDACAVRDASTHRELTFGQLWHLSSEVADQLRTRGVRSGDVVGLAVPRSVDLVVGMLGILRAGAAYLALDSQAPVDRVAMMLAEAEVNVVLEAPGDSAPDPLPGWSLPLGVHRLAVPRTPGSAETSISPRISAASPAYVAYTSGSTGRPKGVVVPHRAVLALVTSTNYCTIAPGNRVASSSNPAFDAITFEVWSTLAAGATIVVLPTVTDLALDRWVELIRTEQITTMFLTTSLFHLVAREKPRAFRTLDTLMVGGEQLDLTAARRVLAQGPPCRLLNVYGPTETTTFATYYECTLDNLADRERTPIGHALQHKRLYVLDRDLRPVAPGEQGELCIGGPGVASGYLKRPDLTTNVFVPEASAEGRPVETIYRTGDLVRELPGGALELLGRRDRQVKLRGFRIELEEIERAAVDTGLAAAAFVEKVGEGGSATLIGFLLPTERRSLSLPSSDAELPSELSAELSAELARRLPAYMLPSRWHVLADLPVGPTGKADRAALMAHVVTAAPDLAEASRNDSPELTGLREIICEVMGLARICDDLSFVELGGNSLLALQTACRVHDRWGIDLGPVDVLRALSLIDLAGLVARMRSGVASTTEPTTNGPNRRPDGILPIDGPAPLSSAQERLVFLDQLFPGSAEYNVPVVVRLGGPLDQSCLRRALTAIAERHEILRSHVGTSNGRPVLVVDASTPMTPAFHDLSYPGSVDDDVIDGVLAEITGAPFDLASGPLWRADLLELTDSDHLLALTFHHMVFDGWSVGVLLRELDLRYTAEMSGTATALPALPIQFRDFAAWQRDPAGGPALDQEVAYWCERLQGVPALQLPVDGASSDRRPGPGRGLAFTLSAEVAQGIRRLSREYATTPFAMLLAGFQALLARYTGERDVAVAVPVAGRTRSETTDLIGFFVNTLVIRVDLTGNPHFSDLLTSTKETLLEAIAHQEVPFERIVKQLHPARDLSRNPLTQVMFGARDAFPGLDATGLCAERYEWSQGSAGFDLAVEVEVSADDIQGRVDFPPGLFQDATVRRLLRHYQTLLAAVVLDPQARLDSLPLDSEAELQQMLLDGTGDHRPEPRQLLHELLTERAAAWPDATALQQDGKSITYRQLEGRAEQVADGLRRHGAGPGTVVAVLLPRGPELVAALLGVLRTGAAYLPIDPAQPRVRLEAMLIDAGVCLALTDHVLAPRLDALPVSVVLLDLFESQTLSSELPTTCQSAGCSPEQLAYVIFTSGSTGRPKPVAVAHRAVVNHALAMLDLFDLRPGDRVLQFASAGFDVFAEELFPTLLAGARLVFPPTAALPVQSVADFTTTLRAGEITVANLPSGFWAQWTKELLADPAQLPTGLRLVVIGSEPVDGRLLERWREAFEVPVANVYGVSEATVSSTAMMAAQADEAGRVPIGRPIPGTRAHVLDVDLRPLPSGVVGELFLGGHGVAQGYLDRPDLTAERFLPDPFGPPGSRLYRTGDLARRRPSGVVDLIGRSDEQVKIRGHRIELGEIESRLAEHAGIAQAAVAARADATGETRLVAYLVCPAAPPDLAELRTFLRTRLPETMLPALFVPVAHLPLTSSGKLDRKALPAPEAGHLTTGRAHRPPQTSTETVLASIWADLLGHVPVGMDDDFFELGGHSLLATQVVSRVRERLSRELPLRAIFESPNIAALALVLDSAPSVLTGTGPSTHTTTMRLATTGISSAPALKRISRTAYRISAGQLDRRRETHIIGGTTHVT